MTKKFTAQCACGLCNPSSIPSGDCGATEKPMGETRTTRARRAVTGTPT